MFNMLIDNLSFRYFEAVRDYPRYRLSTKQGTRVDRGKISFYYRNGGVTNSADFRDKTNLDHFYTFMQLENNDGQFIYVQEKEVDDLRSIKVKGGIMINAKVAPEFIRNLRDFVFQEEK